MPENISNIAKYNIENGTHFWKLSQVNQHKQQKASEEFKKKHPILASFTKSAQDARDAKIGAIGAGQVRDLYNTGNNALASELNQKYLGANAIGILNVPIGSEIATYGLLGGGLRLGAGTATGAAGSWLGGKAGDLADKQFGTNWIGTAGRIGGGFAGFVPGMNAATRVLRTAAGKGVTLYMPQNTFMSLRGQAFDNIANAAVKHSVPTIVDKNILAGKIGWSPKESRVLWHNSETPISKLETTFPTWDVTKRGAPLGHVWTTGTETTQGFIGARPYHNRGIVELNKPMVQLNESIGNGKNAVRNEILKFADQSGADAVNFSNIKDNTLSNQDVYAVFKDVNVKPKLTEAERLGIPKGERSNPKALEDPQYWGYKQWNNRYNAAVESGNIEEAQRLRDLHFKQKAANNQIIDSEGNPLTLYHGNLASESQIRDMGLNPYSTERTARKSSGYFAVNDKAIADTYKLKGNTYELYGYTNNPKIIDANGHSWLNIDRFKSTDSVVNEGFNNGHDAVIINNVVDYGFNTPVNHPRTPFTDYVFKPGRVKLKNAIVEDGLMERIPIVKRDNFHNLDIRYKQGGMIKAQNGAELTKWINNWYTNRPTQFNNYVMFDQNTAINRSNSINEKYEPWDIIQSVIPNSNDSKSDMIGGYYKKSTNTLHLPNTYKKIVNGVVYEAPINPINLNPSNYIHEKTHGIFDWEQKDQIEGILGNQMKDAYYDSPTEVNSRLMEIRYLNGFDPKHVFNKQEVEQLKKNPNFKDRDIFNRYDSETVVKLLNEVASNQSLKNNLSEYSKQGGVLKAQNGKSFESWYKIVPEDKNDTTFYNLRRAYELAPKEELEAFVTDPNAHLRSAYPTKEGNIEFVKSIAHPSLLWELADYNSKPKFNKEWKLSVLKYPYLQYSK